MAPNGATSGDELKSQVAAFRIGDGSFTSVPGEVFPFTYLRGFLGPADMPHPQYGLPPWPLRHMHAPFRFIDGLGEDMLGYIFPRGNGVGVPGENGNSIDPDDTDRFGCGHSDDSEAASSQTGNIAGVALVIGLLDSHLGQPAERSLADATCCPTARYRGIPLGGPEIKCDVDTTVPLRRAGGRPSGSRASGRLSPAAWMSLDGRRQSAPRSQHARLLHARRQAHLAGRVRPARRRLRRPLPHRPR